jgi:Thrombospondin type 3 repeat
VPLALIRLSSAVVASVAGVLLTAVLWKPGVILGAVLVPVIALFVDETLGKPLPRLLGAGRRVDAASTNAWAALTIGVVGFLIAGVALTAPTLAQGEPLKTTPLFGGDVPLVSEKDPGTTPGPNASSGDNGGNDIDGDDIANAQDNCPAVSNAEQADTNNAGRGDACDPDDDNDKVADAVDNCPSVSNPDQADTDEDGQGDVCDGDDDNDGVADTADNCQTVASATQDNADGDELGDACDPVNDGSGSPDGQDQQPVDPAGAAAISP